MRAGAQPDQGRGVSSVGCRGKTVPAGPLGTCPCPPSPPCFPGCPAGRPRPRHKRDGEKLSYLCVSAIKRQFAQNAAFVAGEGHLAGSGGAVSADQARRKSFLGLQNSFCGVSSMDS